jgi:hypothetical protein
MWQLILLYQEKTLSWYKDAFVDQKNSNDRTMLTSSLLPSPHHAPTRAPTHPLTEQIQCPGELPSSTIME